MKEMIFKQEIKSLNSALVNATKATINTTIENGEKWQDLTKKLIKKSQPVRRKQMNMVFDTAEAVKTQFNSGKERVMDLVEFEQAVEYAKNNPVSQKVMGVADDLKEAAGNVLEVADSIKTKVSENPVVQQIGKTSENLKNKGTAKFNDIKEDVLEQAQTILDKGEKMVEGALSPKKAEKAPAATKTTAKPKTATKRTTKATATKATATKTTAKATTTKATATKTTAKAKAPAAKATTATKAAPAKAAAPAPKAADKK